MIRFAAHESVSRVLRARVVAAGLAGLAALPAPRAAGQAPTLLAAAQPGEAPRMLILSDQARRFLALYRAFPTEFMGCMIGEVRGRAIVRSEEHTSELQSLAYLVCRLLLEKK